MSYAVFTNLEGYVLACCTPLSRDLLSQSLTSNETRWFHGSEALQSGVKLLMKERDLMTAL
jgi:hypothetical protein